MKKIISLPNARFWLCLAILGFVIPNVMAGQTTVTLTFDDGYSDQLTAQSLLDANNFKGTFFVNTGDLNESGELSTANLLAMQAAGHEVAGHTIDHVDLSTVAVSQLVPQICNDREKLIELGVHPISFAYPFGSYNAAAEAVVKSCGYISGRIVGGLDCVSGSCTATYAETIPPANAYLVQTPDSILSTTTVAQIEQYVKNAENNGGGWVPIVFHHVCDGCDVYSTSSTVLSGFMSWLNAQTVTADAGTVVVKTMAQVMNGDITLPVPGITAVTPSSAPAGSPAFTLTVTGLNFTASSTILWNGVALSTTGFVNSTTLTTQIPAASIATVGTSSITVANPGLGQTTIFKTFTIGNPTPVLTAITPVSGRQGTALTLTAVGNSFVSTSKIRWNGTALTTTFVSSTTLRAAVSAANLAAAGSASVTVFSSTPNGGVSLPQTFVIYPTVGQTCPCTIFPPTTIPAPADANGETTSLELGVKFKADVDGTITALRFYKIAASTGTHTGHLWTSAGQLLATVTFTGETASGWQTTALTTPIAVTAETTYIASYMTTSGYAITDSFFPAGFDNVPLHGIANTVDVNGVFGSGGSFPTSTANSRNYWADVVYLNTAPTLISIAPNFAPVGNSTVTVTVTGTNFVSSSAFQWNGSTRTTTFVNSTSLTALVPTSDLAQIKIATVTVSDIGLGGATSNGLPFAVNNPLPTLTSLTTTFTLIGSPTFTLTLVGTNFVAGSTILWNGAPRATTFVNSTTLTTVVQAAEMTQAASIPVAVVNSAPGGGTSQVLTFLVGNPAPTLTSIQPSSATALGTAFTLTVTGTNYVSSSTIQWNGLARTTHFISGTQLTADIPASDLLLGGIVPVTVVNPAPGGATSVSKIFVVNNPAPTLTNFSPAFATVGVGFTATITGTNFVSGSQIQVNGSSVTLPFTYVNSSTLQLVIPNNYLVTVGTLSVTIFNPAPAGGTSTPASLFVTAAAGGGSSLATSPRVFPNPWRVNLHAGHPVTFDGLTNGSTIKIFTTSAHWVTSLSAPAGSATWDLKNDSGDPVASGYYIYLITDSASEKVRGIIGIIR